MSVKNPIKCEDGRHIPFEPGDTLSALVVNLAEHIIPGEGIAVLENPDGSITINNTCCEGPTDSTHQVLSIVANMPSVFGGGTAVWTVTLDSPVTGSPLYLSLALSGAEEAAHGYAIPTLVIPPGQSYGLVNVPTQADAGVNDSNPLCLSAIAGFRVSAVPGSPVCIDVIDSTAPTPTVSVSYTNLVSGTINEGEIAIVRVTASVAAPAGGVSGTLAFSGSEKIDHGASYPDLPYTIPAGLTFVDVNVPIAGSDGEDANTALIVSLSVATAGWSVFTGVAAATVLNIEGGSGGGGCYTSGTMVRTPLGYRQIDVIEVGDILQGFHVPGMVDESDPLWLMWSTTDITGMELVPVIVHGVVSFLFPIGYRINNGPLTTPFHRYFVKKGLEYGWAQAKDLDNTYQIVSDGGGLIPVNTVTQEIGLFRFYQLDVENYDTLIVATPNGDVFAHNLKCADCPDWGTGGIDENPPP